MSPPAKKKKTMPSGLFKDFDNFEEDLAQIIRELKKIQERTEKNALSYKTDSKEYQEKLKTNQEMIPAEHQGNMKFLLEHEARLATHAAKRTVDRISEIIHKIEKEWPKHIEKIGSITGPAFLEEANSFFKNLVEYRCGEFFLSPSCPFLETDWKTVDNLADFDLHVTNVLRRGPCCNLRRSFWRVHVKDSEMRPNYLSNYIKAEWKTGEDGIRGTLDGHNYFEISMTRFESRYGDLRFREITFICEDGDLEEFFKNEETARGHEQNMKSYYIILRYFGGVGSYTVNRFKRAFGLQYVGNNSVVEIYSEKEIKSAFENVIFRESPFRREWYPQTFKTPETTQDSAEMSPPAKKQKPMPSGLFKDINDFEETRARIIIELKKIQERTEKNFNSYKFWSKEYKAKIKTIQELIPAGRKKDMVDKLDDEGESARDDGRIAVNRISEIINKIEKEWPEHIEKIGRITDFNFLEEANSFFKNLVEHSFGFLSLSSSIFVTDKRTVDNLADFDLFISRRASVIPHFLACNLRRSFWRVHVKDSEMRPNYLSNYIKAEWKTGEDGIRGTLDGHNYFEISMTRFESRYGDLRFREITVICGDGDLEEFFKNEETDKGHRENMEPLKYYIILVGHLGGVGSYTVDRFRRAFGLELIEEIRIAEIYSEKEIKSVFENVIFRERRKELGDVYETLEI